MATRDDLRAALAAYAYNDTPIESEDPARDPYPVEAATELFAAVEALLDLRPPEREADDDLTEDEVTKHELAESGWWTCYSTVVDTLTAALRDAGQK